MSVDSASIAEIKALTDNYNVILQQYVAANKSLTGLGDYEVLSNKKISGGASSYSGVMPNVEACQSKCMGLNCSVAAYNSVTKGCLINNTANVIDGSLSEKVIINRQTYYLNQLANLNTQLSTINNQIIAKISTINNGTTFNSLRDERLRLKAKLGIERASLADQLENTTNFMNDSNILDLEYIRRDEELETNSNYYMFILLLLIFIITLIMLISIQK
jgi:hypothetical protein